MNFSVTYNSFLIGGASTSNRQIGAFSYAEGANTLSFAVDFVLFADTVSNYATAQSTMLAALRVDEKAFSVVHGATALFSGDPSVRTAYNVSTSISRVASDLDTDRSKHWRFTLSCLTPPRNTSDNDRVASSVAINFTASRQRFIEITAEYAASGSGTARSRLDSDFGTFCDGIISSFGAGKTYKLLSEGPIEHNFRNTRATASRLYRADYDATAVQDVLHENYTFARNLGVAETPSRLSVMCVYEGFVDVDAVAASDLDGVLEDVRAAVLAKAISFYAADEGFFESISENIGATSGRIDGTYNILLVSTGYTFLRSATIAISLDGSRKRSFVITGSYQYDQAAGEDAYQKYEDDIDTFCDAQILAIDGSGVYRLQYESPVQFDDEKHALFFTRVYNQIDYTPGITDVVQEVFSFVRNANHSHGKEGETGPVSGTAMMSFSVDRGGTTSVQQAAVSAVAAIKSKLASLYGESNLIVLSENINVEPNMLTGTASVDVIFSGQSSTLFGFTRGTTFALDPRVEFIEQLDGKLYSADFFASQSLLMASVRETRVYMGKVPANVSPKPPTFDETAQIREYVENLNDGKWVLVGVPACSGVSVFRGRSARGDAETEFRTITIEATFRFTTGKELRPLPDFAVKFPAPKSFKVTS